MKRYKFNVEIKLDTEEKLESDFIEGLSELLNDEVGDICKVSVKEDTKWKKLKEWLEKEKGWNERQLKEAPINTEYYIRVSVRGIIINKILDKIQELEGEDESN